MQMLNVIQSVAERKRTALTQKPLGEFAVLGVLLIGTHFGLSGLNSNTDSTQTLSVTNTHTGVALTNVEPLAPIVAALPKLTQLDIAQVNAMVDLINPSFEVPVVAATNALSQEKINPSDIKHHDSIARFTFKQSAALPKHAKLAPANADKPAPNKLYQFKPSLNTALGINAKNNLFDTKLGSAEALAIWDINKHFSLASKKRAKTVTAKKRKKNDRFVIMIDPGHGGTDPGSVGHNGLQEKALTLDIAKRAQLFLSEIDNISVVLTRDGDTGMSRKNRVQKVKRSNADMVVSLHLNHLPQAEVNLVETFYAAPHNILESIEKQQAEESTKGMVKTVAIHNHDLSFTKGSRQLANLMQKRVFDEVEHNNPDTDNAGVKQDTLYILTRSFTPGVLIEMSCLSNIQEAERLADPAYRDKLAAALADGIRDYLATPEAKRQFGPGV